MTLYVFNQIHAYGEKTGPCIACGKKRKRRITETATENPWNVNEDGTPRTRREIFERLHETKIEPWKKKPLICRDCANGTLWLVSYYGGYWTTHLHHNHAAIGNVYWEPKRDSGNCVVYGPSREEALQKGIDTLTAAMEVPA